MNKKIVSIIVSIIFLSSFTIIASAATLADQYFGSAGIALSTDESASYSATTKTIVGYIKIDSCWLQKKNGNIWVYYCWLPAPTKIEYNTIAYDTYMDYSSYIPNDGGTYRIGAYFNADGHSIPRYSNSRTFTQHP